MHARLAAPTRNPRHRPRRLNGYGFLVERGVHADALGRAAGVPVGRRVALGGQGVARGSGGAGRGAVRSRVVVAVGGALAAGVSGHGPVGVDRWQADDRVGDLRAVDGAQAALSVGVQDAGGGGVRLDSSAPVLSDLADRAGAGRVDGAQARAADRCGDGGGVDARVDREGNAGEAVSGAGGEDRLDGDRSRCEVSDRHGAGLERCEAAGAGGRQARAADRREAAAGARPVAGDGSQAAGDHPDSPPALRGGEGRGVEADQGDRRTAVAVDQGGAAARGGRPSHGARARRQGEAQGRHQFGRLGGSLREGRPADPPARRGRADHRPDRVASRPRRPSDPQGQSWASPTSSGSSRSWRK